MAPRFSPALPKAVNKTKQKKYKCEIKEISKTNYKIKTKQRKFLNITKPTTQIRTTNFTKKERTKA